MLSDRWQRQHLTMSTELLRVASCEDDDCDCETLERDDEDLDNRLSLLEFLDVDDDDEDGMGRAGDLCATCVCNWSNEGGSITPAGHEKCHCSFTACRC